MMPDNYVDALLSLPRMWGSQVSRDGVWVAWTWYGAGQAADVYAAPTDGSSPPLRLTDTADDSELVSWTPDSRGVLVSQDRDGNERAQLFRVDLDRPCEMVPLTEPDPPYFIRGGELHPNGRWLIYGANFDAAAGREIEPTWIYRHDLETGERRVLARPQKGGSAVPRLNSTGTHVLYPRRDLHPAGTQVWLADVEGRDDREIVNLGAGVKAHASWFPDGQHALVVGETETHKRVGVWGLRDGFLRWVLDDAARCVEHAFAPHGSDRVVVVEVREARACSSLLDVETGQETPVRPAGASLIPVAPVGGDWVGERYGSRQPADVVRFSIGAPALQEPVSLSRVWDRTGLRPADFAPAEDFRWRSVDGLPIQGWLYRAQRSPRGTIVYVHGGPTGHSEDRFNPQIQFFTHHGFNVLDPNYRGSTGFGLEFREAIRTDGWGGREQDDLRTGIEALIAAGVAEPGRVGITGTSYGGYSSWCAITRFPLELVAGAAPICGMTDLVVDYRTTRPDLRPYSEEMMGGSPDEVPERYRDRSPINFVRDIRGALLIVQGMQDPNVTPENVHAVAGALRQAGVPYELLVFEDEGHGIARPGNQKKLYLRLLDFFERAFSKGR